MVRSWEPQFCLLWQGIGDAPRDPWKLESVVCFGASQAECILDVTFIIFPVLQLNPKDVVPLFSNGIGLVQA